MTAGEQSLAAHAPEQALEYFSRARKADEGRAMDALSAQLSFGLARAQATMLDGECMHNFKRAFDYY